MTRHGRSDLVVLKTGASVATQEYGEASQLALHWHGLETAK